MSLISLVRNVSVTPSVTMSVTKWIVRNIFLTSVTIVRNVHFSVTGVGVMRKPDFELRLKDWQAILVLLAVAGLAGATGALLF